MYNLIEYSDNYSKASGRLWHHYIDEPALNQHIHVPVDFPGNSAWIKFKQKITGSTEKKGRKAV